MKKVWIWSLLVACSSAQAGQSLLVEPKNVGTTISPSGNAIAFINLVSPESFTNCQYHTQIRWPLSSDGAKEAFSVALTAYASDKKVSVFLVEDGCNSGYPVPTYIHLENR